MKKLEIIIRPGKLDDLRELLEVCEYHGIMITNIMGYGNQKGVTDQHMWRGVMPKSGNTIPKLKVECVVTAEESEPIIRKVCRKIRTGVYGDGKIFITDVADIVRIRTGERGKDAL